eukprot:SAG31_NODE_6531_length_1986_cov_1.684685_2_plen_99_part_00
MAEADGQGGAGGGVGSGSITGGCARVLDDPGTLGLRWGRQAGPPSLATRRATARFTICPPTAVLGPFHSFIPVPTGTAAHFGVSVAHDCSNYEIQIVR